MMKTKKSPNQRQRYRALLLAATLAAAPAALMAQSQRLVLSNPDDLGEKRRPGVDFPHGLHMQGELLCTDCHHDYRGGRNAIDESEIVPKNAKRLKCASCHGSGSDNEHGLRDAFHVNCMGCHRKLAKAGIESGPVLCAGCHPRCD